MPRPHLRISAPIGIVAVFGALTLALASSHCAQASLDTGESQNPINDQGSSYHYRSYITSISPKVPGLSLEVLEFADRLVLTNHTGKMVTIYGYSGESYARVLANGTVQVNTRSPAYYLNQNFYGEVTVPSSASASAPPKWEVVDRTGQFEWHDHRIHWMSPTTPPVVKNKNKRTKIFNWQVPIQVGNSRGAVDGQLFWTPEAGTKTPVAAIVALAVVIFLAVLLLIFVHRRRSGGGPPGSQSNQEQELPSVADLPLGEAW